MQLLCFNQGWQAPNVFTLSPINSLACLIHWRVIVTTCKYLSLEKREEFATFCDETGAQLHLEVPKNVRTPTLGEPQGFKEVATGDHNSLQITVTPNPPKKPRLQYNETEANSSQSQVTANPCDNSTMRSNEVDAIDCHFHLDRTGSRVLKKSHKLSPDDLLTQILEFRQVVSPLVPVRLLGMVANFCDPDSYPTLFPSDSRLKISIGLHPRKVREFSQKLLSDLVGILNNPATVGLGEIGLDWTEPRITRSTQIQVFKDLLRVSDTNRVLILHLRGETPADFSVFHTGLEIVSSICRKSQPIHLHCFSGDLSVVASWATSFPNCYYGFNANVAHFGPQQVAALRAISLDRILLETDAPYSPPVKGISKSVQIINTPAFVGDVAKLVSEVRGVSLDRLLQASVKNAKDLYKF
ncbi:putative deoxyribonuclease TATDN2 [Mercenaria mercenaria]|uniref:putative deoxyribonuclease TATDN2 n=1 Tax=Mercenaria mercenaria TaxID=6596 RepID=UPI00234FAB5A|nr:putative deoxyribonuclease TATDN2 [Mercenaria mercenaria]